MASIRSLIILNLPATAIQAHQRRRMHHLNLRWAGLRFRKKERKEETKTGRKKEKKRKTERQEDGKTEGKKGKERKKGRRLWDRRLCSPASPAS